MYKRGDREFLYDRTPTVTGSPLLRGE